MSDHQNNAWTSEYELIYWNHVKKRKNKAKYFKALEAYHRYFDTENMIAENLKCPLSKVIDIGGGEHGGALFHYKSGEDRILFDFLANEFLERAHIDRDFRMVQGSFDNLPFEDNSMSVIFCWNALDHSQNKEMYHKAQQEIIRILAVGGLLLFECPIRDLPQEGHPTPMSADEMADGFRGLTVLKRKVGNKILKGRRIILILRKD